MTVTLEERVEVLEGKVEKNLEVLTEFRREVNGKLDEFGQTQAKQSQTLDIHTGKFNRLEGAARDRQRDMFLLTADVTGFRNEVSGRLERLDNSFSWLKDQFIRDGGVVVGVSSDVAALKDDITGLTVKVDKLQADFTEFKTEMIEFKTEMIEFKTEMIEFKTEVRGTLAEILDRLPAKAA